MKIAYVTSLYPDGRGEQFFEAEIRALTRLGADVVVVPARPAARNGNGELPCGVLRLPLLGFRTLRLAAAETVQNAGSVRRACVAALGPRYSLAAKLKNVLVLPKAIALARLMRAEGVDHIHAHWLSTPSTIAYVASIVSGTPWSCTAHRFDIFQDNLLAEKAASARFIRAISARNRRILLERAPFAAERCHVLHLGVTLPQNHAADRQHEDVRILCAANLVAVKGHAILVEALAQVRELGLPFECDLAGDGPLRDEIQAQIRSLGLQDVVRLRGAVDHARLCDELANGRYALFVLASTEEGQEFEGIPVALMEAMAAGVPCVATRTGSIGELIEDGVSSLLVEQRNADSLAQAIAWLISDAPSRRTFGAQARSRVASHFDVDRTTRQLFDLIDAQVGTPA